MMVEFRTRKLEREYRESRRAEAAYGKLVARKYIQRINLLKLAIDLNEVKTLPGLHCHPLKGNRKGQWAAKLTGFHRLVFTVSGDKLDVARVEEVSAHYGD